VPINPMASRWCNLYRGTPAEHSLEPAVAALGVPYRTQYPLFLFSKLRYFPDFVLLEQRVIIEVDDPSHDRAVKREEDAERTAELQKAGWRVVRCTNDEAIARPFRTVQRLMAHLKLDHLTATDERFRGPGQSPSPTDLGAATSPPENSAAPKSRKA
jgi:very-short-patch-repair endonuclease